MNFESLGELQPRESGIFEIMKALPRFAAERDIHFWTPSGTIKALKPVGALAVPFPMSWSDEARDTSAWLGNVLQQEAVEKLYAIGERVRLCPDKGIQQDWNRLQASDHFFYMSTKHSADGNVHSAYSPYNSPYTAFTNYMNVLSDFMTRVEQQFPADIDNEELNSLLLTINNQEAEIEQLKREVEMMRGNITHDLTGDFDPDETVPEPEPQAQPATESVSEKPDKKPAKKPAAKRSARKKPADQ